MSRWTHADCADCFEQRHHHQIAHRVVGAGAESCCYCGKSTSAGMYDRNDPQTTPCLGRNGTTHREEE